MYFPCALLLALFITTGSFAANWRPYVGVGGLMEQPIPFDNSNREFAPHAPGACIEAGLQNEQLEWYVAYYASQSQTITETQSAAFFIWADDELHESYVITEQRTSWRNWRVTAGVRRYVLSNASVSWSVLIGGAINVGDYEFLQRQSGVIQEYNYPAPNAGTDRFASSHYRASDMLPGITTEFGLRTKPSPGVQIMFLARTDWYLNVYDVAVPSAYDSQTEQHTYVVVNPSLALQLRYVF